MAHPGPYPVAWKIYDDYAIKNSVSVRQLSSENVRQAKININSDPIKRNEKNTFDTQNAVNR